MNLNETLDVTQIEPKLKHPTIFGKFDNLQAGEAFVINNDHDPKPLYYQLLGERGDIFTWEYLENGPELWKVKIAKKSAENRPITIGEISAKDYRKAEVFKKFGIDFCCGGGKTIKEACLEAGISEELLKTELLKTENQSKSNAQDYDSWDIDFLSDYIINTHHKYVKANINLINEIALKVARVHGDSHPEVTIVAELYGNIVNEFPLHLQKEEEMLFPYIKEIVNKKKKNQRSEVSPFGTVEGPIQMMMSEHEAAGDYFRQMRIASNDFDLPADACNSYTYLYEKLKEFEADLHTHVHLENNILFPKAIKMEKELLS